MSYTIPKVQHRLGLVTAPYHSSYIKAFMDDVTDQRAYEHCYARERFIRDDAMSKGDYGDMKDLPLSNMDSGNPTSFRNWLIVLLAASTTKESIVREPQRTKGGLLSLPTEILTMIFNHVFSNGGISEPSVDLGNRWGYAKIEYSSLRQVCSPLRTTIALPFLKNTSFVLAATNTPWNDSREALRYLKSFTPQDIALIRNLTLAFADAPKWTEGYRAHFASNPALLQILELFVEHGGLRKLMMIFSATKRRLTTSNKDFLKVLKAIKVDEVEFAGSGGLLGGKLDSAKGDSKAAQKLKAAIEKAMVRRDNAAP